MNNDKPTYTVYKKKLKSGKRDKFYTVKWLNWKGKFQKYTSTYTSKQIATQDAIRRATEAYEMRVGVLKPPSPVDDAMNKSLSELVEDYLQWGNMKGGKAKNGWSELHAKKTKTCLNWWLKNTKWKSWDDINFIEAEKLLVSKCNQGYEVKRNKKEAERKMSGKTLEHYRNYFQSFINWYRHRFEVYKNPFKGLTGWDKSVKDPRRDLTVDEIGRLLSTAPFDRATIYWTAIVTGLRRGELSRLTDESYSYEDSMLSLKSDQDKERQSRVINLPVLLNNRIREYIKQRGECEKLFNFDFTHAIRFFDEDLRSANIDKRNAHGKLVFHSLRDTQVNLGIDLGADIKTGMNASRHATTEIYLMKYAKRKDIKVKKLLNDIDELVFKEYLNQKNNSEND